MIVSRAAWMSVVVLLAGALSACALWEDEPPAAAQAAPAQCYASADDGATWVLRPELSDEMCFEMDACEGGVGLLGRGCYKWATAADAPRIAWADLGFQPLDRPQPPANEPAASCYYSIDDGQTWGPMARYREAQCFHSDACYGGLGALRENGERTCYKWALGPDAPPLPWSRSLTHPQPGPDIPPPDPVYEGAFEQSNDCDNIDCSPPARFAGGAVIYRDADASSPVIAEIPATECVEMSDEYRLLEAPRRGVVLDTAGGYTAGEVIYALAYQGEGYVAIWRSGEVQDEDFNTVVVRWDPPTGPRHPRAGFWRRVTRANGDTGWVRDVERASCD